MAFALVACGERTRPSAGESDQLNNAAEMLDSAADELEAVEEIGLEPANSAEPRQ